MSNQQMSNQRDITEDSAVLNHQLNFHNAMKLVNISLVYL